MLTEGANILEASDVVVVEAAGHLAVRVGLRKQRFGLDLEHLHGVGTDGETGLNLFQRSKVHRVVSIRARSASRAIS